MIRNAILFFLSVIILNTGSSANDNSISGSEFQSDSLPGNILIINSFDAMSMKARKNKKEFFAELADSLKYLLYNKIEPEYKPQVLIIPGVLKQTQNLDSSIFLLMDSLKASIAIVVKDINVDFQQTNVEVTGEKHNKTRTAYYDILSNVTYGIYNSETKLNDREINVREFHSKRDVVSGLLAFGPDVVSNKKDAFKILDQTTAKLFLSADLRDFSSMVNKTSWITSSADTSLKYTVSFADQSQLLYDKELKLKVTLMQSFMEAGDISYYNGKYFNSRERYTIPLAGLPISDSFKKGGLFNSVMHSIDTSYLTNEQVKIYSRAMSSIGMLYETRGKFAKAEALLLNAMNLREMRFGKNSKEYLNSLQNVAVLKKDMGLYEEADSIFNYLVPIFKDLFTVSSPQYVVILNNKAMLLAELGRTKEAIQLLNEALSIGENVLSPSYFDFERILTNRAILEQELEYFDKSREDYQMAIANMEKKGFDDHPDYNNILVHYGSFLVEKGDPDVLSFLSKATDKIKKRYTENHPLMAKALINTADYYLNKKSYAEAKDVYNRSANIQLKVLGEKHKDYLNTLIKLAVCEWYLHDNANATIHFNKAIQNYLLLINTLFRSMSEAEKSNFWRTLKPNIDTYLSFAIENGNTNPALLKDAYNLQLKTKGILINSTKETKNIILNSGDSVTRKLYNDWLDLKNTLSVYYSSPLEDLEEDKIDLETLEQQANELEKELSRRSSRFSSEYMPKDFSFDDVRAKLSNDEAVIEIIRIFHYYGERKGESEYIALIVKKDVSDPILVHIGNGGTLEQNSLSRYKQSIKNKIADPGSYSIYWQPLESSIGAYKTIYVSVDGVYNSINLNTLQKSDGTFILDDHNIVLVPNTRSVAMGLKSMIKLAGGQSEAFLLGSPLYGNDNIIPPLPGTKEEIQRIDTLLLQDHVKTRIFIEQNASEENIKSADHPFILHIATHGFFNENVDLSKSMNMGVQVSRAKDNALLRSGLLFNGAASIYNKEPILDEKNNGVLYANEAMNLNLQGTNLVVLSACETGLGEIINGEGVYGLTRAFQVAGADKILMSLWKVDDQTTRELMITFYKNWLRLSDPQQAFMEAQKSIRKKYPQPYYWGAFILLN